MPVDPGSPLPLYYQLKQLILERIHSGELAPGDQVPTESELCERYGVSRTPVRQALLELTREGILSRRAGRGTFVRPASGGAVTLRVIVPDDRWRRPLDDAVARYNAVEPPETLELEVDIVPLEQLHDRLVLAIAQGRAPDICVLDTVWAAEFAHRHYLCPLDELDPAWTAEVRGSFHAPLLAAGEQQGRLQALPINADATVLWYRRDWLVAEGLAPPATWAELVAVGRHFQLAEARRRYGLGPHPLSFVGGRAGGETATYQLLPLLWAAGGGLIEEGRVVLDSPGTCRALTFLRELVQTWALASPRTAKLPWNGALRDLALGRAALAFGGSYEKTLIEAAAGWDAAAFSERVGFVPLPSEEPGGAAMLVGGMAYAITRQSRLPRQAVALLKLALAPETLAAFSRATSQNAAQLGVAELLREGGGYLERAAGLIVTARSRPALPAYDLVSAQFQELVELCVAGRQPVDELAYLAAERISGITGLPNAAAAPAP